MLALVYLAWLLDRVAFLVPAFGLSLLFAGGLSVSGHDAVDPGSSWKTEIADWVHISAASLWIGALATMAGLLWFGAPQLRRQAFMRFSRLATVLIVLVLSAGIYLSIVRLPHLHDLWTEGYGQVLLVKIGLVCFALAWGAFHHFVVRPALDRADAGFLSRIGRSLVGESLVAVSVLLVAAVLVDSRPPPRPIGTFEYVDPRGRLCGDTHSVKILLAAIAAALVAAPTVKVDAGEPTYGLASSGGSVWVGGLGSGDVLRLDPATGKVLGRSLIGARIVQPRCRAGRGLGGLQPDEHGRPHRHADRQGDRVGAGRQRPVRRRVGLRLGVGLQLARRHGLAHHGQEGREDDQGRRRAERPLRDRQLPVGDRSHGRQAAPARPAHESHHRHRAARGCRLGHRVSAARSTSRRRRTSSPASTRAR